MTRYTLFIVLLILVNTGFGKENPFYQKIKDSSVRTLCDFDHNGKDCFKESIKLLNDEGLYGKELYYISGYSCFEGSNLACDYMFKNLKSEFHPKIKQSLCRKHNSSYHICRDYLLRDCEQKNIFSCKKYLKLYGKNTKISSKLNNLCKHLNKDACDLLY